METEFREYVVCYSKTMISIEDVETYCEETGSSRNYHRMGDSRLEISKMCWDHFRNGGTIRVIANIECAYYKGTLNDNTTDASLMAEYYEKARPKHLRRTLYKGEIKTKDDPAWKLVRENCYQFDCNEKFKVFEFYWPAECKGYCGSSGSEPTTSHYFVCPKNIAIFCGDEEYNTPFEAIEFVEAIFDKKTERWVISIEFKKKITD
jgi:hypothetical protein